MLRYFASKTVSMIIMLFAVSVIGFVLIQLPPGDYVSHYIASLEAEGAVLSQEQAEALRRQYGLDLPLWQQYLKWIGGILQGDFGRSFQWNREVSEVIGNRLPVTIMISVLSLVVAYSGAIAAGIHASVHQYGVVDNVASVFMFVGQSVPNFILTIVVVYLIFRQTGVNMTGLYSMEYASAPWSAAKFWDMIKHLPIPVLILGISGMTSTFRITRGNMLDELGKTYVTAARARGLSESRLLMKYPARVAMNPVVSSVANVFPNIVSGGTIVACVLNLPMVGPLLLTSLRAQDMYLAGFIVVFLSALTIIGMYISDLLLMIVDPRIKIK